MTVSAVVVTYNRLLLLQRCISAIRSQTESVRQTIVVNNSSTDGTLELTLPPKTDPRIM